MHHMHRWTGYLSDEFLYFDTHQRDHFLCNLSALKASQHLRPSCWKLGVGRCGWNDSHLPGSFQHDWKRSKRRKDAIRICPNSVTDLRSTFPICQVRSRIIHALKMYEVIRRYAVRSLVLTVPYVFHTFRRKTII